MHTEMSSWVKNKLFEGNIHSFYWSRKFWSSGMESSRDTQILRMGVDADLLSSFFCNKRNEELKPQE